MNEIAAIGAVGETAAAAAPSPYTSAQFMRTEAAMSPSNVAQIPAANFSDMISEGLARMDAKVAHADRMVTQFAVDDSTPVHQVTIALEEARLAVELAMQVRQRFVEGYRELMNLQL